MIRKFIAITLFGSLAVLACDKSATDAQNKADRAQAEANKDINQANSEATTKITNAQVEADKKIAEARGDFAKTREDFRHDVQTNIDDLDHKLEKLDAKAKKATGKTKADLDAQLPALHARRDAFVSDVKSIETSTAATWDATKARIEKEWSDLKASADKVD